MPKTTNTNPASVDWDKWNVSVTNENDTGLRLFEVTAKSKTSRAITFAEFNSNFDVHAVTAWAGARTSRSADAYANIFTEIKRAADESKYSSGEKLSKVFVNYGHASVAGMAPVFLYINKIPMLLPFWSFNHLSIGDGQELSTRYVRLDDLGITPIERLVNLSGVKESVVTKIKADWVGLQNYLTEHYHKWYGKIEAAHLNQFQEPAVESDQKLTKGTLNARTLDIVRFWIPAGASTSMAMLNSVRMWIDLVVQLREHPDAEFHDLADQIVAALSLHEHPDLDIKADLGGLTKYAYARGSVTENVSEIDKLAQQLDLDKVEQYEFNDAQPGQVHLHEVKDLNLAALANYILTSHPNLNYRQLLDVLNSADKDLQEQLGKQLFNYHTHHNIMRNAADIRSNQVFELHTALAYARDLNRHRAWGRFIPMLETQSMSEILDMGFEDNFQLRKTDKLQPLREEFNQDMEEYYKRLRNFFDYVVAEVKVPAEKQAFILRLLPLAHSTRMFMSAPIAQQAYAISQRIAGGGDFGYRQAVYKMLKLLRAKTFTKHMLPHINSKIDPNSRQQFTDRS